MLFIQTEPITRILGSITRMNHMPEFVSTLIFTQVLLRTFNYGRFFRLLKSFYMISQRNAYLLFFLWINLSTWNKIKVKFQTKENLILLETGFLDYFSLTHFFPFLQAALFYQTLKHGTTTKHKWSVHKISDSASERDGAASGGDTKDRDVIQALVSP